MCLSKAKGMDINMEKNSALQWHPGFCAALRITFREELEYLEMYEEYQLGKKPMQIDILIIKKNGKNSDKKINRKDIPYI